MTFRDHGCRPLQIVDWRCTIAAADSPHISSSQSCSSAAGGASAAPPQGQDLKLLSIEQLMEIDVTWHASAGAAPNHAAATL